MILGSLRLRARQEVREIFAKNPSAIAARRGLATRTALSLFWLLGSGWSAFFYVVFVAALFYIRPIVASVLPDNFVSREIIGLWSMRELHDANDIMIATQATLVALVFPVGISLVTFLSGQRSRASAETILGAYRAESGAFRIAASSFILLLTLIFTMFVRELYGEYSVGVYAINTAIHMLWLFVNVLGAIFFGHVSLHFATTDRVKYVRQHAIETLLPFDAEDRLFRNLWAGLTVSFKDMTRSPLIQDLVNWLGKLGHFEFRSSMWPLRGDPVVTAVFPRHHRVVDVWMGPIFLAMLIWRFRNRVTSLVTGAEFSKDWVVFSVIEPNGSYVGKIDIFKKTGGLKITALEKLFLSMSIRFRESE